MSISAALIILLVVAALGALIAVQNRRSKPKAAPAPDCTLDDAWRHYFTHPSAASERDRKALDGATSEAELRERLEPSLHEATERAIAAERPLIVLREAIMDATDRFLMVETLYDHEDPAAAAPDLDAASIVEAGVLRRFASLRYGDAAEDDWYTHYLRVAEMSAGNVAAMLRKTVSGEGPAIEASLHRPMAQTMREAREGLLHHPPQTPVSRATQLAAGPHPDRRAPDQHQIEQLSELMSVRFEKLFAGQLYQREDGTLIDPVAAFEVEAALLHSELSAHFRQPDEAWRRVLENALGGHGEAVSSSEDTLLALAHDTRRAERATDGSFQAALRAAVAGAFHERGAESAEAVGDLAADMHEEGISLVAAIRDVARSGE
jgi:hypothetical protein